MKRVPATHSRRLLSERNFRRTTDGFFPSTNQRLRSGNALFGFHYKQSEKQWRAVVAIIIVVVVVVVATASPHAVVVVVVFC